jgi:hypothetical protein
MRPTDSFIDRYEVLSVSQTLGLFLRHVRVKQGKGRYLMHIITICSFLSRLSLAGDQSQCSPVPPSRIQPKVALYPWIFSIQDQDFL